MTTVTIFKTGNGKSEMAAVRDSRMTNISWQEALNSELAPDFKVTNISVFCKRGHLVSISKVRISNSKSLVVNLELSSWGATSRIYIWTSSNFGLRANLRKECCEPVWVFIKGTMIQLSQHNLRKFVVVNLQRWWDIWISWVKVVMFGIIFKPRQILLTNHYFCLENLNILIFPQVHLIKSIIVIPRQL